MKTFLLAVDFSPVSDDAIDAAIELAAALKARVVLLHVASSDPEERNPARDQLARYAALLGKAGIECHTAIAEGDPVPAILREAKTVRADYIIMGSHGRGKVYQLLVGSTVAGVLRKTACMVMLIPPAERAYE